MAVSAEPGRRGWVVGRLLLSGWIVLTSITLISGAHGRPYFVVVGVFSIVVVAALTVRLVVRMAGTGGQEKGSTDPAPFHTRTDGPQSPLDRLRQHDPTVADQVQVALDLLTGPLVGVLGSDATGRTRSAIVSALAEFATVDAAIERTVTAQQALSATLGSADIDVRHDADAQRLGEHAADLCGRRAGTVDRLQRAATGLQAAWAPVRDEQILRLRHGRINQARDHAEKITAQPVPSADASMELIDAIEEIQGSLGGVREVSVINDRILGDGSDLDTSAPELGTSQEPR